jgi:hypothetical protein
MSLVTQASTRPCISISRHCTGREGCSRLVKPSSVSDCPPELLYPHDHPQPFANSVSLKSACHQKQTAATILKDSGQEKKVCKETKTGAVFWLAVLANLCVLGWLLIAP